MKKIFFFLIATAMAFVIRAQELKYDWGVADTVESYTVGPGMKYTKVIYPQKPVIVWLVEVDLTDVYFATEEEYLAAKAEADKVEKVMVLDEVGGTHTLAAGDWGWDSKWLGTTDVSAFNTAVIEVESVIGHGKINFQEFEIDLPASETAYSVTADISSVASIEQYAYQNVYKIDEASEVPDGETVIKVKKVYLTSKTKQEVDDEIATGISDMIAAPKAQNNVRYNLLGVKNGAGIYIMNGKKYMK